MARADTDTWDPQQYGRFAAERDLPFFDLLGLVRPAAQPSVVDLGCGDGRLTAAAHERLGARATLGIDSSPSMLEGAPQVAGLTFAPGDIGTWTASGEHELVMANSSLHWVPDHAAVLGRWRAAVAPGGQLAVQLPANADHASHTVLADIVDELGLQVDPDPVAVNVVRPEQYAQILDDLGAVEQHVRLQVYAHHLPSTADVVEWVKGTTLTRVRKAVDDDTYEGFLARYRERLLAAVGDRSPYPYLFKRIHLWGSF